jgi:hypothetical protein
LHGNLFRDSGILPARGILGRAGAVLFAIGVFSLEVIRRNGMFGLCHTLIGVFLLK